jgi:hypothetical protein
MSTTNSESLPIVMPVELKVQAFCPQCQSTADVTIRTISELAIFEILPPDGWNVSIDTSPDVPLRVVIRCNCTPEKIWE